MIFTNLLKTGEGAAMMDSEQRKKDLQILTQLYDGNHLEPSEVERAFQIVESFNIELKRRLI